MNFLKKYLLFFICLLISLNDAGQSSKLYRPDGKLIADSNYNISKKQLKKWLPVEDEMIRIVMANLKYPEVEAEAQITGLVVVSFTINDSGVVRNVAIERKIEYASGISKELMQIILGTYLSGTSFDGYSNSERYYLPIEFSSIADTALKKSSQENYFKNGCIMCEYHLAYIIERTIGFNTAKAETSDYTKVSSKTKPSEIYRADGKLIADTNYRISKKQLKRWLPEESDIIGLILKHINYPEAEAEAQISGRVIVSFCFNSQSNIDSIRFEKHIVGGPGFDREVKSVLLSLNTPQVIHFDTRGLKAKRYYFAFDFKANSRVITKNVNASPLVKNFENGVVCIRRHLIIETGGHKSD